MSDINETEVFRISRDGAPGLTWRQSQSTAFLAPSRGVRVRSQATTSATGRRAALLGCDQPQRMLTDLSAAAAWGLPVPARVEAPGHDVSVAVPAGSSRPRRADVRGRRLRLPSEHCTELRGQPITTPARTWLDCAAELQIGDVVAMGDAVLRRNLATQPELRQLCAWAYRRRGVVLARQALPLLDPGAESPGESRTRVVLMRGGIRRPRCNAHVYGALGWLARADLLWDRERVIVEYDGIVHLPEERRRADAVRRNLLQEAGYRVLVFTAEDLRHPERMVYLVRQALSAG